MPTLEERFDRVQKARASLSRAHERSRMATALLREDLAPKVAAAVAKVNADPDVPYRFGRHHLTVREDGYVNITLNDITHTLSGQKVGGEEFDGTVKMPWLEAVRAAIHQEVGFPSTAQVWISVDGYYFDENK